MVLALF